VCRSSASSFRTFQITCYIREGTSEARIYGFAKDINVALKANQVTMNTRPVYFSLEQPLWKNQRNIKLRHIRDLLATTMPNGKFETDWSVGSIWMERERHDPLLLYTSEKKSPVGKFVVGVLDRIGIIEAEFLTALAASEAEDI
jgi:hypothetical protein